MGLCPGFPSSTVMFCGNREKWYTGVRATSFHVFSFPPFIYGSTNSHSAAVVLPHLLNLKSAKEWDVNRYRICHYIIWYLDIFWNYLKFKITKFLFYNAARQLKIICSIDSCTKRMKAHFKNFWGDVLLWCLLYQHFVGRMGMERSTLEAWM